MSLVLGKSFNRNYNTRIPFLEGFYNVGIFFNNRSSFLLFSIDSDFSQSKELTHNVKINMFKNIESSIFCETFLNLHNYRNQNLDIQNQFKNIKSEYLNDITYLFNETLILSKLKINDSDLFDTLTLYCFSLSAYSSEFLFLLAERQNVVTKLNKKIVRTYGIQIATTPSLNLISDFNEEARQSKILNANKVILNTEEIIKL